MPHKLLLADDSITIQRVIELTFADEDVQVLAVGDGKKAIASIQSDRPDIVLADVGMPERDGYEVAEFIKGNPQLANIPVLLLTGAFEPIDETRARAVGCDGVLVKPFEPQMVINRVKDLLAGRRSGGLWGNKTTPSPPSREAPPPAPEKDASVQSAAAGSGAAAPASLEDYFDRLDAAFASVEAATEAHGAPAAARSAPTSDIGSGSSGLAGHDLEGWDPDLTGDPVRPAAVPPPSVVTPPAPAPAAAAPPAVTPTIRFKPATPVPSEPPPAGAEAARPAPPLAAAIPFVAPVPPPVAAPAPVPAEAPPTVATAVPLTVTTVGPPSTVATTASPVLEPREPPPPLAASPAEAIAPSPAAPIASGPISLPSLAEAFATLLSAEQGRTISPSKVGASSIPDQTVDEIVNRVIDRLTDQSVRETVLNVAERLVREEIERIKGVAR